MMPFNEDKWGPELNFKSGYVYTAVAGKGNDLLYSITKASSGSAKIGAVSATTAGLGGILQEQDSQKFGAEFRVFDAELMALLASVT